MQFSKKSEYLLGCIVTNTTDIHTLKDIKKIYKKMKQTLNKEILRL